MVPLPSIVDALLHLLNLLVLFHKEVLCFDSSLNRTEMRTGQGSSLVVNVGECWKGDYRWLAWAEDTKGASCD